MSSLAVSTACAKKTQTTGVAVLPLPQPTEARPALPIHADFKRQCSDHIKGAKKFTQGAKGA